MNFVPTGYTVSRIIVQPSEMPALELKIRNHQASIGEDKRCCMGLRQMCDSGARNLHNPANYS